VALIAADTLLPVVDGLSLPAAHRHVLKPGALLQARDGTSHRLPRYFYQVESWPVALATALTPHFGLWEFIEVDLREAAQLRAFPRYVPCALSVLAAALEVVRLECGMPVRIAANGGYRSPSHAGSTAASPHCWGTAANIYRIGADSLDSQERIERYAALVRRVLPLASVRPYGSDAGMTDDHLHVDLGYVTLVPHGASEQDHAASSGHAGR